ncbi:LytR C-terminal domain-containing protein [Cellulosimicrobium marinum]|uniref:LytR C-terminal domain-containing protein n=1 Tax=Cellulosimicrobium marinum TaxID=1638992 RepID=UPI001E637E1F|nr:LytR C-terminal domain-containing protein [Cellulosimicrobium marinum]MCB7136230.1 LytR C-terminal domain-containing protein [Cellulosimicrobium marinum]
MTTEPDHARSVRRRRMHERQAVVFGLLIAALAVVGLGALAVYTGAIDAPFERALSTPETVDDLADVDAPCLPEGTAPVAARRVHVTVLNASGRDEPLAGLNEDVLLERGFSVDASGNAPDLDGDDKPDSVATTQIHFGAEGIAQAYTLAAHYPDPGLVLDDREGGSVTLYVGADFDGPVDPELVGLEADVPMESVTGCVPLDQVTPRPVPVPPAEDEAATEG